MIKGLFITITFSILIVLPIQITAQDISALIKEAEQLQANFKDREALKKYSEVLRLQPNNMVALCRTSELLNVIGRLEPTKDQQKKYYTDAKVYAERALKIDPNNADANFAMALAMGRMALNSSGSEKVNAVRDIRIYAERCIRFDPGNFKGYHVMGKWHYEVSDLSSIERWLVKITYGALPKSSLQDAIRNYEKSRQLNPRFLLNYLELAKAYIRNEQKDQAKNILATLLKLPNNSSDDGKIKNDATKLLKNL